MVDVEYLESEESKLSIEGLTSLFNKINFPCNFITETEKAIHQVQGRQNLSYNCGWKAQEYQEKQI